MTDNRESCLIHLHCCPDSSVGRAGDWKSPCPWFDSASGHQFQKRHQLKAGFFMPKAFSKLPFKEFSLSTDVNWDYPISSAKSDINPDTFDSIMTCIHKIALKPLLARVIENCFPNDYVFIICTVTFNWYRYYFILFVNIYLHYTGCLIIKELCTIHLHPFIFWWIDRFMTIILLH